MHGLQACLFKYITAAFRIYLSVVKMPLKGEVGGHALKGHRNYIVDHGKAWKKHGIVFLNFCRNPARSFSILFMSSRILLMTIFFQDLVDKHSCLNATIYFNSLTLI